MFSSPHFPSYYLIRKKQTLRKYADTRALIIKVELEKNWSQFHKPHHSRTVIKKTFHVMIRMLYLQTFEFKVKKNEIILKLKKIRRNLNIAIWRDYQKVGK